MEEEKLRELEAAQAETVRKLASAQRAADRAAELQFLSPSLRTYVSQNPDIYYSLCYDAVVTFI